MIKFIFSFLFIFVSSYLFASFIRENAKTKTAPVIIYTFLSAFAQIIFSFEILSLFKAVNELNFLVINFLFFIISLLVVKSFKIEIYKPDFKAFLSGLMKAAKADKLLFVCLFSVLFFILLTFILVLISPVSVSDAMSYHVPRAVNWIINSSLNHFQTLDMRMNTMPVNSELIYAWVIMYLKSDIALGMVAFLSYINAISVLYCFLAEIGFCIRKRIWTVFVFSALACVVIETSGCDTNLFTGSLVLTSLYLFYCGIKYKNNLILYISALALSIVCGVKTTAIIALPSVALFMIYTSIYCEKREFYKLIIKYGSFFAVNFFVFSAYNYILNFLDYGSFVSTAPQYEYHRLHGGIKSYLSSCLHYMFMLIDLSGLAFLEKFGDFIIHFFNSLHLLLLGIPADTYKSVWYPDDVHLINFSLLETQVGMGLIGLIAFFPSVFVSLFSIKMNKTGIIKLFGYMYAINILLFTGVVFFTYFNSRYLTAFAVISSPVLVLTYFKSNRNLYKWLVLAAGCCYLLFASQNNPYRMTSDMVKDFKVHHSIKSVRDGLRASLVTFSGDELNIVRLRNYIVKNKIKRIGFFSNFGELLLPIDLLRLKGYKIDYLSFENLEGVNLKDYDAFVVHTMYQKSDNIQKYDFARSYDGIKRYYDENNDVSCYYVNNKNVVIKDTERSIPVYVNCSVPFDLFDKSGYKVGAVFPYDKYSKPPYNKDNNDLGIYIKVNNL